MSFVVGLDFGQAHDPTALAILERPPRDPKVVGKPVYSLRHLQRFALGTPYDGCPPVNG